VPPEPRLQGTSMHGTDPQFDLRQKMQQDTQANEKTGWIDQSAGIVQIPVKDAMKLIAEKGLPAVSTSQAESKDKKKEGMIRLFSFTPLAVLLCVSRAAA